MIIKRLNMNGDVEYARAARVHVGWAEMQPVVIYTDASGEHTVALDDEILDIYDEEDA